MPAYKTNHVILTPVKQHDLGSHVDAKDLGNQAEVDRLIRIGAIEPLEGYERPEPRPDQGDDPTPRGVVGPDWFAGALTPEEIDAQIEALKLQREGAVKAAEQQKKVQEENDKLAVDQARRGPGRPAKIDQQAV